MEIFNLNEVLGERYVDNDAVKLIINLLNSDKLPIEIKTKLIDIIIFIFHSKLISNNFNELISYDEESVVKSWLKNCPSQIPYFCNNSNVVSSNNFKLLLDNILAKIRDVMKSEHTKENDKQRLYIRGKLGLIFSSNIDKLSFNDNQYFTFLNKILEMDNCTFDCLTLIKELLENPIDNNPERNEILLNYIISNCSKIVVPKMMNNKIDKTTNGSVFISRIIRTEALWKLDREYIEKVLHISLLRGHSYFMYRLLMNNNLSISRMKLLIDYYDVVLNNFYIDDKFVVPEMLKRSKLPLFNVEEWPKFNLFSDNELGKILNDITNTKFPFSMAILYWNLHSLKSEQLLCAKEILNNPNDGIKYPTIDDCYEYRYIPGFEYKYDVDWACYVRRYDAKDMLARIACLPSVTQLPLNVYKKTLSVVNALCVSHNQCDASNSNFRVVIDNIYDMFCLKDKEDNFVYIRYSSRYNYILELLERFKKNRIDDLKWKVIGCSLQFAASPQSIYYDDEQFKKAVNLICHSDDDFEIRKNLLLNPTVPFVTSGEISSLIDFAENNDGKTINAYLDNLKKESLYLELKQNVNPNVLKRVLEPGII